MSYYEPDLEIETDDEAGEDGGVDEVEEYEWETMDSDDRYAASDASYASSSAYPGPPSTVLSASASFPALSTRDSNLSSYTSFERSADVHSSRSSPARSVISITESIETRIYREEHGRSLNNYTDSVYRLPADDEEWERLEKQHRMFIDIMGAKYPPPMGPIMASNTPGEKRVLDLGAGNGAWLRDVCRDWPLCEALAVDLVPLKDVTHLPPNFRCVCPGPHKRYCKQQLVSPVYSSEVDDINMGLQHFYGKFDVVHCRLISSGIRDYQLLIEHISRVLRPGGLIELAEFDFTTYDGWRNRVKVSTRDPVGPPWWATFMANVNEAIQASGGDVDAATHLLNWIKGHEAFENVVYREFWLPVVPGHDTMYHENVYTRMKDDVMSFLRSGKPLLLGNGVSEADYDLIEQNAIREIHESEEAQYTRLQCVYATKRYDVVLSETFAGQ